jgi:hypothetical protein
MILFFIVMNFILNNNYYFIQNIFQNKVREEITGSCNEL